MATEPDDDTALDYGPGLYDGAADDLWFLPDDGEPAAMPLPRADRRPLLDPQAWLLAQNTLSGEIADLAYRYGILDERLRAMPAAIGRLALIEAEDLSWWVGDRISVDRLVLWMEMSLAGVQVDNQALMRASWAARRLMAPRGYGAVASKDWVADILGRDTPLIEDFSVAVQGSEILHPLARAAYLFYGWRLVAPEGGGADIEAAVLAGRAAAAFGRGGAMFLPLGIGAQGVARGAAVADRLAIWLAAAERGVLAGLLHLDRLQAWQGRAETALADLSGRTAPALRQVFAQSVVVSAPLAEAKTAAGRSAVQRNIDVMQARGLIREMTGQGRYRLWTAKL